jgi:hypothetical protein
VGLSSRKEKERVAHVAYTFFGIQVAVRAFFKDDFRTRLHQAIARGDAEQSLADKRRFWKGVTAIVNEAMPVFERGFWDLIRSDEVEAEFESWCSEIEGSLATTTDELGAAADEVNRASADSDYVLVTMAFLLERGSNSDQTLGERCDLPEPTWFTRQTFAHLIASIPLLNFANVQADAVYVVPGNDTDGLSSDDLSGEGYEYLKPLG